MAANDKIKKGNKKEYVTKCHLYRIDGTRVAPNKTITEDELPPGSIPSLLESGAIADPDAPIAPGLASAQMAHELLAATAIAGGVVVKVDGGFTLGDRKIDGDVKAVCAAVSIEELQGAIVKALVSARE